MTDKQIDELAMRQADFRNLQSNHKYDYKSCRDSFAEGLHEGLTVYGVAWDVHIKRMVVAIISSLVLGFLIGLI